MIKIGETHTVIVDSGAWVYANGADKPLHVLNAEATEAVKRLVEAHDELYRAVCDFVGDDHVPRGLSKVLGRSATALASFTETEQGSDPNGLRLCATPENDGSTEIKGDQHG